MNKTWALKWTISEDLRRLLLSLQKSSVFPFETSVYRCFPSRWWCLEVRVNLCSCAVWRSSAPTRPSWPPSPTAAARWRATTRVTSSPPSRTTCSTRRWKRSCSRRLLSWCHQQPDAPMDAMQKENTLTHLHRCNKLSLNLLIVSLPQQNKCQNEKQEQWSQDSFWFSHVIQVCSFVNKVLISTRTVFICF